MICRLNEEKETSPMRDVGNLVRRDLGVAQSRRGWPPGQAVTRNSCWRRRRLWAVGTTSVLHGSGDASLRVSVVVGVLYKSMKAVDERQWLLPYVKINAPRERLSGYIWDSTLHYFLVHPAHYMHYRSPAWNNDQVIAATCRRRVACGRQG